MRLPALLLAAVTAALAPTGCSERAGLVSGPDPRTGQPSSDEVVVYTAVLEHGPLLYANRVPVDDEATPAAAVQALLNTEPRPAYSNLWHGPCAPATDVEDVAVTDQQVVVRLRDDRVNSDRIAICDLTIEARRAMDQQMAWTVRTATGSTAPAYVVIVDGGDDPAAGTRIVAREKYLAPAQ